MSATIPTEDGNTQAASGQEIQHNIGLRFPYYKAESNSSNKVCHATTYVLHTCYPHRLNLTDSTPIRFNRGQALRSIRQFEMILRQLIAFLAAIALVIHPLSAQAADYPPPLSYSHAQLTGKDFSGQNLQTAEFANANLQLSNFAYADLRGAIFSGSVMTHANLHGADLSYGMLDQADLTGADLSDVILVETLLLGSVFDNTLITGADFTDALLDGAQLKHLCQQASGINSKTGVATSDSLGCSS